MAGSSADPRRLELVAFCRHGAALAGQASIAAMPRLAASLAEPPGDSVAEWSACGALRPVAGGEPELWLHLRSHARVTLQCQRCLEATQQDLEVDRQFRFVADEDEAARLDELSEDDVLALPTRLDLLELLEDELILALPVVPRHTACPQPLLAEADVQAAGGEAQHPFAALARLRRRPGDAG